MKAEAQCRECFQFKSGVFAALQEEERDPLSCPMTLAVFEKKQPVFIEGEAAHLVYLVHSGLVKVHKMTSRKRTQIINVVGTREILGIESLFSPVYNATTTSLMRSEICYCQSAHFYSLMERRPSVSLRVIDLLHNDLNRTHSFLCDLGTKKAISRVASCLFFFLEKLKTSSDDTTFQLPIMRNEMSELLGISPETISRQLKQLVDLGLIEVDNKRFVVKDVAGLRRLAAGV